MLNPLLIDLLSALNNLINQSEGLN